MRFVPIKTKQQQSILALHRVRSLLVRQRTATINALRRLLGEYGLITGKGIRQLAALSERLHAADESIMPNEAREALRCLFRHIDALSEKLQDMEARIIAWHQSSPDSQRLASAPGVGPITATAIVAAVGDGKQFKSSRHFAAWLGLTPRIKAVAVRKKFGRISKGGDPYLRTLLIHGARAVVGTTFRNGIAPRPWLKDLVARRPTNGAATAVAHDTARSLWAMMTRSEEYRHHPVQLMAA